MRLGNGKCEWKWGAAHKLAGKHCFDDTQGQSTLDSSVPETSGDVPYLNFRNPCQPVTNPGLRFDALNWPGQDSILEKFRGEESVCESVRGKWGKFMRHKCRSLMMPLSRWWQCYMGQGENIHNTSNRPNSVGHGYGQGKGFHTVVGARTAGYWSVIKTG